MMICALCGETTICLQKEIDGKEYDICSGCWAELAEGLKGKGRTKNRETVFLPQPREVKGTGEGRAEAAAWRAAENLG